MAGMGFQFIWVDKRNELLKKKAINITAVAFLALQIYLTRNYSLLFVYYNGVGNRNSLF